MYLCMKCLPVTIIKMNKDRNIKLADLYPNHYMLHEVRQTRPCRMSPPSYTKLDKLTHVECHHPVTRS